MYVKGSLYLKESLLFFFLDTYGPISTIERQTRYFASNLRKEKEEKVHLTQCAKSSLSVYKLLKGSERGEMFCTVYEANYNLISVFLHGHG